MPKPVKAWIAFTDGTAFGVLFAYGGVAVAPVSIGACAIGLFAYGAAPVGVFAVGGFAFGIWAFGAMGFGWQASMLMGALLLRPTATTLRGLLRWGEQMQGAGRC